MFFNFVAFYCWHYRGFRCSGGAPFAHIGLPRAPVFYTAIIFIWCGLALRLWAIETLGHFFRISVLILEEHNLVTTGPYCYLRHPAYAGTLITVTGIGLAQGNWISVLAITSCMFVAYVGRIGFKEKAMRARFGDRFDDYSSRTWAIVHSCGEWKRSKNAATAQMHSGGRAQPCNVARLGLASITNTL